MLFFPSTGEDVELSHIRTGVVSWEGFPVVWPLLKSAPLMTRALEGVEVARKGFVGGAKLERPAGLGAWEVTGVGAVSLLAIFVHQPRRCLCPGGGCCCYPAIGGFVFGSLLVGD